MNICGKLLAILDEYKQKEEKSGKTYISSTYLNNIIELVNADMQKTIERALDEKQHSWFETALKKQVWEPTKEVRQYFSQFTEDTCNQINIPTLVRKSFISGRFDPYYHEGHDIVQQVFTHW